MIKGNLEYDGVSVVALGSFNPRIFHPLWFSRHNLIRPEEADEAEVRIVHNDIADFATAWFSLQVLHERYSVETSDPTKHFHLRDLASGTFKILEHTPIRSFGFNSHKHFRLESEVLWHAFGDHYAPKADWKELLVQPGMRTLVMEGSRSGCDAKRIQIRLEPSNKVHPGILVSVNEHYDLTAGEINTNFLLERLGASWTSFLQYSSQVSSHLLKIDQIL